MVALREDVLAETKQEVQYHLLNSLLMYLRLAEASLNDFNETEAKFVEDLYIDLSEPKSVEVSFE